MKSEKDNGILMLVGLVCLLALPVLIGHFTIKPAAAETIHAEAVVKN